MIIQDGVQMQRVFAPNTSGASTEMLRVIHGSEMVFPNGIYAEGYVSGRAGYSEQKYPFMATPELAEQSWVYGSPPVLGTNLSIGTAPLKYQAIRFFSSTTRTKGFGWTKPTGSDVWVSIPTPIRFTPVNDDFQMEAASFNFTSRTSPVGARLTLIYDVADAASSGSTSQTVYFILWDTSKSFIDNIGDGAWVYLPPASRGSSGITSKSIILPASSVSKTYYLAAAFYDQFQSQVGFYLNLALHFYNI